MQMIPLYRYTRPGGGVTVSTVKPDTEYTELSRLVADDGFILTDGETFTSCTDTDNPSAWSEVVDGENPEDATETDYQNELRRLGVEV
jgi:hypothetical protein